MVGKAEIPSAYRMALECQHIEIKIKGSGNCDIK
jgi:hypothetical protein